MMHTLRTDIPLLLALLVLSCSYAPVQVADSGGGSEVEITGKIFNLNGSPAMHTRVRLIPADYDPVADAFLPDSLADTTDAYGTYVVKTKRGNTYNIEVVHFYNGTRTFIKNISSDIDSTENSLEIAPDTLKPAGTLVIPLPDSANYDGGYIFITGTSAYVRIDNNSITDGFVVIDSVPAGEMPAVVYSVINDTSADKTLADSVAVVSGEVVVVDAFTEWQFSRRICLNTTPGGADVAGNVCNFPVLVRLRNDNFNFSEALEYGEDLRFTRANGVPLPYEIEEWNSRSVRANIWVKVDTVYGNDSTQYIKMLWGNADAVAKTNGAAVFDTTNGFEGVWHLDQTGSGVEGEFTDATYNGNHGQGGQGTAEYIPSISEAVIDKGQDFDGIDDHIDCGKDASLNITGYQITLSAWVKYDTLTDFLGIVGCSGYTSGYRIGINDWDVNNFEFQLTGENYKCYSEENLYPGTWYYVCATFDGSKMMLFIDGYKDPNECAKTDTIDTTPSHVWIGHGAQTVGTDYSYPFDGVIDEVRISSVSRSADWIKLCYMNQKENEQLIVFGE